MPAVPMQEAPSVQSSNIPSPYRNISGVTPEAFGVGFGKEMEKTGDTAAGIALREQALINEATAREHTLKFETALGEETEKMRSLSGNAAIAYRPQFIENITKIRNESLAAAQNPIVKRLVDSQVAGSMRSALVAGAAHVGVQARQALLTTAQSQASLAAAEAGRNTTEAGLVNQIQIAHSAADAIARAEGFEPGTPRANELRMKATTDIFQSRLTAIAKTNPDQAQKEYEKVKKHITAEGQVRIENTIRSQMVQVGGTLDATEASNGAGAKVDLSKFLTKDKDRSHVDNMDAGFAGKLKTMFDAMPPELQGKVSIYSGARTVERQQELWDAAVQKYGSPAAARMYVAPPGHSNHNKGMAADLRFESPEVRAWIHDNAEKYGLHFRMSHENWHIEPIDKTPSGPNKTRPTGVQLTADTTPEELATMTANARALALSRSKDDPALAETRATYAENVLRGRYNAVKAEQRNIQTEQSIRLERFVLQGEDGKLPVSIEQLMSDDVRKAEFQELQRTNPRMAERIIAQLKQNATPDEIEPTPEREVNFMEAMGLSVSNQKEFMERYPELSANLPTKWANQLLTRRIMIHRQKADDKNILKVVQPQLEAAGIDKKNKLYNSVVGRLHADVEDYQKANKGALPNDEQMQEWTSKILAKEVIKKPGYFGTTVGETRSEVSPVEIPDVERGKISEALRKAGLPVTESEIQRMWRDKKAAK